MGADREATKEARMQKGIQRKERMLRREAEKRRQQPNLTDSERRQRGQNNKVLAMAKAKMDEELDDVKHMNQMVAYAQCVTIRDAQIREKHKIQQESMESNRQADLAMEIERMRQLNMHGEREKQRALEQRIGAQVIVQQIQEREAVRLVEQEKQEQEAGHGAEAKGDGAAGNAGPGR